MAFGFSKLFKGIGKGIRTVDKVASTPIVGDLLKSVPVLGNALNVVHSMDTLFLGEDTNELKKKVAVAAMKDLHPGVDVDAISAIIEAMVAMKKKQATQ